MKVAVLNVATGGYVELAENLHKSLNENFMTDHDVDIFLFTDSDKDFGENVKKYQIERKGFPGDTLYRYHYFLLAEDALKDYDFLFYLDVDLNVEKPIGEEIVADIVACEHPGFYRRSNGTFERRTISTAYVPPQMYHPYYCGGVQGGRPEFYLEAARMMKARIDTDDKNSVMAVWHDESHWNRQLKEFPPTLVLDPRYCYPTDAHFPWIEQFSDDRIITTVAKDEEEIRKVDDK